VSYRPWTKNRACAPSGLVFDYRLTLPAYLESIAIRLAILVAVVKNYQSVAIPELTNMVNTLVFLKLNDWRALKISISFVFATHPDTREELSRKSKR
jgi:hypothetical protein